MVFEPFFNKGSFRKLRCFWSLIRVINYIYMQFSQMFLRKDATKHQVIRVDKHIRKTTIYAKIALIKYIKFNAYTKK